MPAAYQIPTGLPVAGPNPVYDVTNPLYGAKWDGVTDDTAAVQAAIQAATGAGGGIVQLPPGTGVTIAQLVLRTGVWLRGAGIGATTIKKTGANSVAIIGSSGGTDMRISDLTINANGATGGGNAAIYQTSPVRLIIERVRITLSNGSPIILTGTPVDAKILFCEFDGNTSGQTINAASNTLIEGCTVNADTATSIAFNVGADCLVRGNRLIGKAGCQYAIVAVGNDTLIEGNWIDWTGSASGTFAIGTQYNASRVRIIGNHVQADQNPAGIYVGGYVQAGQVATASDCVVANNTIFNVGNNGILLSGDTDAHSTGTGHVVTGNVVNTVKNNGPGAVGIENHFANTTIVGNRVSNTNGHGIWCNGVHSTIEGNQVQGCGNGVVTSHGIQLSASGMVCVGNTVIDQGVPAFLGNGIEIQPQPISAVLQNYIVANNHVEETRVGAARGMGYAIKCDTNTSTPDFGYVHDNYVTNAITANVSLTGTNNRVKDNPGYNPVGTSAISVTASPFTYTAGASPETVYVTGGTVSVVSLNGTTISAATNVAVNLEPNQAVIVTYSVLPTMIKDVH